MQRRQLLRGLLYNIVLLFWGYSSTILVLSTNVVVVTATAKVAATVAAGNSDNGTVLLLNRDNYDELVQSKSATVVFVKFFAPWCNHCQKVQADWQKLAEEYNNNNNSNDGENGAKGIVVAEVDCTDDGQPGGGKALCDRFGIESFPTLMYGDPKDPQQLDVYNGKQSFEEMSAFAKVHLVSMQQRLLCSPTSAAPELCTDDATRAAMQRYAALSVVELESSILEAELKRKDAKRNFERGVRRLTKEYERAEDTKRAAIQRVVSVSTGGRDLKLMRQTISMLKREQQQQGVGGGSQQQQQQQHRKTVEQRNENEKYEL